jgi:hypothetical protein
VTGAHQLADAEIDYFDDEAAASPAAAAGGGHRYYEYVVQLDVSEMSVTHVAHNTSHVTRHTPCVTHHTIYHTSPVAHASGMHVHERVNLPSVTI